MKKSGLALLAGISAASLLVSCTPSSDPTQAVARHGPNQQPQSKKKKVVLVRKSLPLKEQGKVSSISLTDAFALQQADGALICDARPPFYFAMGHIPGAINIPKGNCEDVIAARKSELDAAVAAKKPIIVYCTNFLCADARTVATHLAYNGISSAVMGGGWDSWKESGLPTQ